MVPVVVVFGLFVLLARDSPQPRPRTTLADYGRMLGESDTLWLSFLYSMTFGGFVGLASFLTTFFHEQYGLTRVMAGDLTTVVVVGGSFLRPVGGWLSDRVGGYRLLVWLLGSAALCMALVSSMPPVAVAVLVLGVAMGLLGMGNGAVFQLVPQRFKEEIGIMTGLVGMAGGVGGFYLASSLGFAKQFTGSFSSGFLIFAGLAGLALAGITFVKGKWRTRWTTEARI